MDTDPAPTAANGPTVKLTPKVQAGQTVYCKSTHVAFKVLKVMKNGDLSCQGRAGLMPKTAFVTELPKTAEED